MSGMTYFVSSGLSNINSVSQSTGDIRRRLVAILSHGLWKVLACPKKMPTLGTDAGNYL